MKPKRKINAWICLNLALEIKKEAKLRKVSIGGIITERLYKLKKITKNISKNGDTHE
jgi:hypothetical protein